MSNLRWLALVLVLGACDSYGDAKAYTVTLPPDCAKVESVDAWIQDNSGWVYKAVCVTPAGQPVVVFRTPATAWSVIRFK